MDQATNPYALLTSSYLALQSLPLLFTPSLLLTLSGSEPRRITDLETYLSRTLALTLLALAAQTILLSDILPLGDNIASDDGETKRNVYAKPTVMVTTVYHAASACYLYTQLLGQGRRGGWTFAFTAGMVLSAGLFCFGVWVLLFGEESSRLSKSGVDKRMGNFPFGNKESAREKKKEEKERAGGGRNRRSVLGSG